MWKNRKVMKRRASGGLRGEKNGIKHQGTALGNSAKLFYSIQTLSERAEDENILGANCDFYLV